MNTRDKLKIMDQVKAANKQHVKDWKQRHPEKVACDDCTDRGHCPEYQSGALCVADRKEIRGVVITKSTVVETVASLRSEGKSNQEIEDEFKDALKAQLITVDVYSDAMIAIYGR